MPAPPTTPNTALSPLQESTSPLQPIGISDQLRQTERVDWPTASPSARPARCAPTRPSGPLIGPWNPTVHREELVACRGSGLRGRQLSRCFCSTASTALAPSGEACRYGLLTDVHRRIERETEDGRNAARVLPARERQEGQQADDERDDDLHQCHAASADLCFRASVSLRCRRLGLGCAYLF